MLSTHSVSITRFCHYRSDAVITYGHFLLRAGHHDEIRQPRLFELPRHRHRSRRQKLGRPAMAPETADRRLVEDDPAPPLDDDRVGGAEIDGDIVGDGAEKGKAHGRKGTVAAA